MFIDKMERCVDIFFSLTKTLVTMRVVWDNRGKCNKLYIAEGLMFTILSIVNNFNHILYYFHRELIFYFMMSISTVVILNFLANYTHLSRADSFLFFLTSYTTIVGSYHLLSSLKQSFMFNFTITRFLVGNQESQKYSKYVMCQTLSLTFLYFSRPIYIIFLVSSFFIFWKDECEKYRKENGITM